jgi:hypothetical protein
LWEPPHQQAQGWKPPPDQPAQPPKPPWYRRAWFVSLVIIAVFGTAGAVFGSQVRQQAASPAGVVSADGTRPAPGPDCHPAYPDGCIPPSPPDLDCRRIRAMLGAGDITVDHTHGDPHGLDGDGDGVGCEERRTR